MQTFTDIEELRQQIQRWKQAGDSIGLVPTMGNLHAGHIELVKQAKAYCQRVLVSIFVNPTQFGPHEDLASYPRTLAEDQQYLLSVATDALFLPTATNMYPTGTCNTQIIVTHLTDMHCGAKRPGHFAGVATVVNKLFNIVQPNIAFFGEKDWQQLAVIRQMVADLNIPIQIVGVPTVREADGLAMSSRNAYLTPSERLQAPLLYQVLSNIKAAIRAGNQNYIVLEEQACHCLAEGGFTPDYIRICQAQTLQPASPLDHALIVLAAARLGKARLIDNIQINLD